MKTDERLYKLNIQELSELIKHKEVSPVELTKKLIERIETFDSNVNSFITINAEEALQSAARAEKEILNGEYRGPLHGVPVGLKDIIYTEGKKTTMGSEIFKEYVPEYNATVVNRLEQAGAIIVGKLNTHQFAYGPTGDRSYFGAVKNPYDTTRITGGSSSGSGAAVAADFCYGALGTDTGGSVRVPASFCGIVGMKPTYGLVSKFGVFPLSQSLDHVGPMTKTVLDNAILLNAISGYDPNDPSSKMTVKEDYSRYINKSIEGLIIGVPNSYYFENLDSEVEKAINDSIERLKSLGAKIKPINIPNMKEISEAHRTIIKSEAYAIHEQRLKATPNQWDDEVKERLHSGLEIKGYEFAKALTLKQQAIVEYNEVLENVDVIVTPTVPILPTKLNERTLQNGIQHIRELITKLTLPTNLIGFPSLSIPCAYSQQGIPIGIQFIGKPFDEANYIGLVLHWSKK